MNCHGRRVIYTDYDEINENNVVEALSDAFTVHELNRMEIQYLYDYYKGKQDILNRVKDLRKEICNKIVENRANEIVSFKVGYLMGEPVQYVTRGNGDDSSIPAAINTLNEYMFAESKAAKDFELAEWFTICGTANRMVIPNPNSDMDESPFEIYTLDPRNSFVVYHSGLGNKPMMGVRYVTLKDNTTIYSIYTKNRYFEIKYNGSLAFAQVAPSPNIITKNEAHIYGGIPIIEYPANSARLGSFEIVLPLLDALNTVSSNRVDGVEQFIQSLLILKGMQIDDEAFARLKEEGGLKIPQDGDVYYITQELNQAQTQTLVDYMYQSILVIVGMPNRNGGSSTSDTGAAVIMRDGWSDAEARAKDAERMFEMSEKQFLRLVIEFVNTYRDLDLKLSTIDIRFTRRNYENIQAKAQVLTTLLNCDWVHPQLAYEHCGLFIDPDLAYTISKKYYDENQMNKLKELEAFSQGETTKSKASVEIDESEDE